MQWYPLHQILLIRDSRDPDVSLRLSWTGPDGPITYYTFRPPNPWVLLHLDGLFPQGSILDRRDIEQLEWAGTPEQVHIAKARLALYDSLQGK